MLGAKTATGCQGQEEDLDFDPSSRPGVGVLKSNPHRRNKARHLGPCFSIIAGLVGLVKVGKLSSLVAVWDPLPD